MDALHGLRASGLVEMTSYNLDGIGQHNCNLHRSKGLHAVPPQAKVSSV